MHSHYLTRYWHGEKTRKCSARMHRYGQRKRGGKEESYHCLIRCLASHCSFFIPSPPSLCSLHTCLSTFFFSLLSFFHSFSYSSFFTLTKPYSFSLSFNLVLSTPLHFYSFLQHHLSPFPFSLLSFPISL